MKCKYLCVGCLISEKKIDKSFHGDDLPPLSITKWCPICQQAMTYIREVIKEASDEG